MKRFTLIIDGHNFFFRSLWSCFRQGSKTKILSTQKDIDSYEKKMMIDFCSVVKSVSPIVNDIVFIKDSHSWRKELLLEHEYKGNRKRTQDNIDRLSMYDSDIVDYLRIFPSIIGDCFRPHIRLYTNYREV